MCVEIHSDALIVSAESIRNNWIFLRLWIKTVSVTVKLLYKKNSIENNEFMSYSYWETFFFLLHLVTNSSNFKLRQSTHELIFHKNVFWNILSQKVFYF